MIINLKADTRHYHIHLLNIGYKYYGPFSGWHMSTKSRDLIKI